VADSRCSAKRQLSTGIIQGVKEFFVQPFIAQAAIERLDENALLGLS
jgi:hypothetical protein